LAFDAIGSTSITLALRGLIVLSLAGLADIFISPPSTAVGLNPTKSTLPAFESNEQCYLLQHLLKY